MNQVTSFRSGLLSRRESNVIKHNAPFMIYFLCSEQNKEHKARTSVTLKILRRITRELVPLLFKIPLNACKLYQKVIT